MLETGRPVKPDGSLVVPPRPDIGEGDTALRKQPGRLSNEHLADAPAAVTFGDEKLCHLAFQPRTRVVEDDPAEANDLADLVPDNKDDVLAAERGGDLGQVPLDLLARQLRVVDVVDLFAQVELDEKRLDQGIITGRQSFHVESSHPRPMLA